MSGAAPFLDLPGARDSWQACRPRFARIPGVSQFGATRDFQFDVWPDGQRFIVPTTGPVAPRAFTVIEN